MKRDYPEVFQRIFKKYKNLILRVGCGGNLKKIWFFRKLFLRGFEDIKKGCNFCLNFFLISLTLPEIFHGKENSAFFSRGDITPKNCIMAPTKIGLRYG